MLLSHFEFIFIVYYDVSNRKSRADKGKAADIDLVMNFTNIFATARFWEVRVSQIPFSQRAPAGCLQYFVGNEGTIQVLNTITIFQHFCFLSLFCFT